MNDMTKGDPKKQILAFMVPVLLGNLFQQFYNVMDIIIVGNFLGVDALAAVGMTGSISFFVVGWICGMTSGFGILIAQAFGAGDNSRLKHYVAVSVYICIAFAIAMSVGLTVANEYILRMMNTPDNIFGDTKAYIGVIYAGLSASILFNMLASIARAMGDSKTPLYFLTFSSVVNISLDLLFVGVLPFGVVGAAYATIISQGLSGILCLIYVMKKYPEVHFGREEAKFKWYTVYKLMSMGIPMGLQFSITAIGSIIVQSSLNLLGATYIAAYAAAMKIQGILMQVSIALGSSVANFVGQNFGAGRIDRVRKGVKIALVISVIVNVLSMIVAYDFCPSLVVYFAEDTTGELVAIARQCFHVSLWFYIPLGLIFVYRNALQGIGNGFVPMMGGVCELLARGITVLLAFESLQFIAICISDPIAWFSALVPLIPFYYWTMHKMIKDEVVQDNNKIGEEI